MNTDYPNFIINRRKTLKCLDTICNARGQNIGQVTRVYRDNGKITIIELDNTVTYVNTGKVTSFERVNR